MSTCQHVNMHTEQPATIHSTQYQGFGIGLNIVTQIVKQQGWQLSSTSHPTIGNQVVLNFNVDN